MAEKKINLKLFDVIKEFTKDRLYKVGYKIPLCTVNDKKTIETLTSNKFIK